MVTSTDTAEIETMRKTRGSVAAVGEDGEELRELGEEGKPFKFDEDAPCPISFGAGTAVKDMGGLAELTGFVTGC